MFRKHGGWGWWLDKCELCLGNMEDEDEDWINVNSDDVPSEECWMNKDKLEEKNQEGSDDEVDDDLLVATIQIQPGSTPSAAR